MDISEVEKLEYIREIGFTHMRISEGLNTHLQIIGCIARLAVLAQKYNGIGTGTSGSSSGGGGGVY